MTERSLISDKGIACQALFSQLQCCIMLLLNPIHYGKHGATEDGLKCLRYVLGIFLWSADECFSITYFGLIEGKISHSHFKAVFTDFHHNVLRKLICMYYRQSSNYSKFGKSDKSLKKTVEQILGHVKEDSPMPIQEDFKAIFKGYQDFYHKIFQDITRERFVDHQLIITSKHNDILNNHSNASTTTAAIDVRDAGKQKILTFFKYCLSKKASTIMGVYKTVESRDQSILREQLEIFQKPLNVDDNGPNADFIRSIFKNIQDGVHRHGISEMIVELLNDYRKK